MKRSMLLLMFLLPIFSSGLTFETTKEERLHQKKENGLSDSKVKRKKLTLLGKQFENVLCTATSCGPASFERRTVLFFDTDGDTNTTEAVAAKYCPCLLTEAKIFDAKIGDTKTSLEWRDALKHKDEDRCIGKGGKRSPSAYLHRLVWVEL